MTNEEEAVFRGAQETAEGKNLRELWDNFRETGDVETRNELTEFYFDMVRANSENIATILMEAIEEDDLSQTGAVAFFEAMNDFDPVKHNSFEEFGSLAIRRAIVETLRALIGTEELPGGEGQ